MSAVAGVCLIDVPYHADKVYSYYVPESLEGSIGRGYIVEVPFGKGNRRMTGYVSEYTVLKPNEKPDERLKPVTAVLTDEPLLNYEMLGLCRFMKDYTLCTYGEALRAVVPAGALTGIVTWYSVTDYSAFPDEGIFSAVAKATHGKTRFTKQYLTAELGCDASAAIDRLVRLGAVEKYSELKKTSGTKQAKFYELSEELCDDSSYEEALASLRGERQREILRTLREGSELPAALFRTADGLVRKGLIKIRTEDVYRNPYADIDYTVDPVKPVLSEEQKRARDTVVGLYETKTPQAVLLHGVTGSGKTNVIMDIADRVLEDGRGVIMLVPEIALTPQTVTRFAKRFGHNIAVIHSGLSAGERFDSWKRIKNGEAKVVVGTRSAIFAPLENIGLIVIDEEQEYTYKSETNPKYTAHDIARYRCREHKSVMLLASATPSVTSYYKAVNGSYTLVELKERYGGAVLPETVIYDMRREIAKGNLSPVGALLAGKLKEDAEAGNQAILFLNRRGYHKVVTCRSCGESIKCPHCSVTMTYHALKGAPRAQKGEDYDRGMREGGYLSCHMCGYRQALPETCPSCSDTHFIFMGCGTQKAEEEIAGMFPDLRVLRMDLDTTQTKNAHEEILDKFRNGEADVLLGTQMVTKGHDFPKVATVGVLDADNLMYVGDYRAAEKTFDMLTQVAGRAGRADVPGVAVIQTMNPFSAVVTLAAAQDYRKFYEGEIKIRKALCYPPFCDIAVITLSSEDEEYLQHVTAKMNERLIQRTREEFADIPLIIFGPFEAPVYKVQNRYRMRFVLKCRLNRRTRELIGSMIAEFSMMKPDKKFRTDLPSGNEQRITVTADLNPSTV